VDRAVAVVVTDTRYILLLLLLLLSRITAAAVLPEERADAMFHSYDGGGVTINGPSILVRKQLGNSFSMSGKYYVDSITSASIDVVATASPYNEKRTEYNLGLDYLRDKVTMSAAFTISEENDFNAKSMHLGVSQEIFGGMTTVSLGYSRGWDTVGKLGDPSYAKDADRQNYRIGLSQVLTKNLLMELGYETITDEGFLNNPYRRVRYLTSATTFDYQDEIYPNTRTTNAVAFRAKYYLPYRAALHGEYRIFNDTWGINASNFEVGYTHPFRKNWIFDFKVRSYTQTSADFYNDLFPFVNAQNFLARDKELSSFSSLTYGAGVSYEFAKSGWRFIDKGSINFSYNRIRFDYDDFRNIPVGSANGDAPGAEPLYGFDADVVQFYISIWY